MSSETLVHVASGKVRELFTIDDGRLLLVASDRSGVATIGGRQANLERVLMVRRSGWERLVQRFRGSNHNHAALSSL